MVIILSVLLIGKNPDFLSGFYITISISPDENRSAFGEKPFKIKPINSAACSLLRMIEMPVCIIHKILIKFKYIWIKPKQEL